MSKMARLPVWTDGRSETSLADQALRAVDSPNTQKEGVGQETQAAGSPVSVRIRITQHVGSIDMPSLVQDLMRMGDTRGLAAHPKGASNAVTSQASG